LEVKLKDLQAENEKLRGEFDKVASLRAAYNADKKAFNDKIVELEVLLAEREKQRAEVQHRLHMLELSSTQYRDEINFWNGKCTTLKRDLEYSEKYA